MEYAVSDLKGNLTKIILAKRDFNAALDQPQDTYSPNPTNYDAISGYIQALYALHDYDGIVKTVEDLRESETTSTGWNAQYFLGLRAVHP